MPAAVEMPHRGSEVDSRRIDQRSLQRLEIATGRQQAAAHRPYFPVDLASFHELADEGGQ